MGGMTIRLDRDSTPGVDVATLAGVLDGLAADGLLQWLQKYVDHFGCAGKLHIDVSRLQIDPDRALPSLAPYQDLFQQGGGELRIVGLR